MDTEIVQLVEQAGPYLTAAVGAYGAAVLGRAEDAATSAAADATANVGRRLLRAVWHRGDAAEQAALATAVQEVAEESGDEDAAAALRQQVKRALRDDAALRAEVAALLGTAGGVTVNVSGARAIGAQHIGIAVSGDNATVHPPRS
ncbi:hypothetical protein [Streptomyces sp. NBC_01198]|uniref:hypothetical protein n=1 Tax=Streptomyces sp. NBC_01198 TaxID=2903769 RepID=UPI002E135174|nr:hypothetical protein OG702_34055 [Streptomyces sp. NBC_01198]